MVSLLRGKLKVRIAARPGKPPNVGQQPDRRRVQEPQKRTNPAGRLTYRLPRIRASRLTWPEDSEAETLGREVDPSDVHVGRDVEHGAVPAPAAVGGGLARRERTEMGAIRGEDQNAAGRGREHVAVLIDFHSVGQPF